MSERGPLRRLPATLAWAALWLGITLAVAEAALQVASLFVHDRAPGRWPEAPHRVLCIGDSHTYGALVAPEESYPARLQTLLDERAPGAYAVINLGVPGMNTAEVLARLPVQVNRYRPDVVLAWVGINDFWNHASPVSFRRWLPLDAVASRSRLYRLVRVWLHDRRLEHAAEEPASKGLVSGEGMGSGAVFTVVEGGRLQRLSHVVGDARTDDAMAEEVTRNYEGMARWARTAGVPLIFISYPIPWGKFEVANRAMRHVGTRFGVPVLDSSAVLPRVPPEERRVLWGGHPRAPVYREVARDLVPLVVAASEGQVASGTGTAGGRE